MNSFRNTMLCEVSYDDVRKAMNGEHFPMSLTNTDEIEMVVRIVNQGIDSALEACYIPDRGDQFEHSTREIGGVVYCTTLECKISPESMPVFLRRLSEDGSEEADHLLSNILDCLGFDDNGTYNPETDE